MEKRTIQIILIFIFLFGFVSTGFCENTIITIKGGLLGAGLDIERSITERLSARVGASLFPYDYTGTEDDIEYDFELDLMTVGLYLDWHPFKGSFRLTGGMMYNGNNIDANGKSAEYFDIGDETYAGSDVGTLKGEIDFNEFAPYAGLGWNTAFGKDGHWGFIFELGVMFQGTPKAKLTADGPIADNSQFQVELAKEENNLQDDLDKFDLFPNISMGISYKF